MQNRSLIALNHTPKSLFKSPQGKFSLTFTDFYPIWAPKVNFFGLSVHAINLIDFLTNYRWKTKLRGLSLKLDNCANVISSKLISKQNDVLPLKLSFLNLLKNSSTLNC